MLAHTAQCNVSASVVVSGAHFSFTMSGGKPERLSESHRWCVCVCLEGANVFASGACLPACLLDMCRSAL
eukprot:8937853-Alexandrium_andersonii.AAC.1